MGDLLDVKGRVEGRRWREEEEKEGGRGETQEIQPQNGNLQQWAYLYAHIK